VLQRSRAARDRLQGVPLLDFRIRGAARARLQCQRGRDPEGKAGERRLAARRDDRRADRAELQYSARLNAGARVVAGRVVMAPFGAGRDAAVLELWERGAGASPIERALLLASMALPELGGDGSLPLGERDRAIAGLRRELFGPAAEFISHCPDCGAEAEVVIADVAHLYDQIAAPPLPPLAGVSLRAVTSDDLIAASLAAAAGGDPHRALIDRIATFVGENIELVPAVLDAALEALDPAVELRFDLTCPGCATRWTAVLDVAEETWR